MDRGDDAIRAIRLERGPFGGPLYTTPISNLIDLGHYYPPPTSSSSATWGLCERLDGLQDDGGAFQLPRDGKLCTENKWCAKVFPRMQEEEGRGAQRAAPRKALSSKPARLFIEAPSPLLSAPPLLGHYAASMPCPGASAPTAGPV